MSFPALLFDSRQPSAPVVYPDSDGQPMADNSWQFEFIQTMQGNLNAMLPDFVAGDHLWYPVEGRPDIRIGPDVYVALGRPKGHRGSYRQWEEGGVAPQVVFEWWSPNNSFPHQVQKLHFYERYGVQEFYAFDQVRRHLGAFVRPEFRDVTYFYGIDFHQDLIDYKNRPADFLTLYVYLHPVTRSDAPLFLLDTIGARSSSFRRRFVLRPLRRSLVARFPAVPRAV